MPLLVNFSMMVESGDALEPPSQEKVRPEVLPGVLFLRFLQS
jgi:hypothetical protein